MRYTAALLLVLSLCVGPAAADTPFDVTNLTARGILVQVDEDVTDYSAIGSMFGTAVEGTWISNGTIGVVTVSGSVVENLISTVFDGVTVVPGSFTDYQIVIDLATLEVTNASISGQIDVPILGTQAFTQTASSTTLAGFELASIFGLEYPAFCTSGTGCTIVPGLPYDPATGQLNAVGEIDTLFQVFTPFGDLRLTEVPAEPFCDVEISQPIYVDGETTTLNTLRYANLGGLDAEVRLRLQLSFGTFFTFDLIDIGAGGGFSLPSGADFDLGPLGLLPVSAGLPRGSWSYRCALEDPTTGTVFAEDVTAFELQ